VKEQTLPLRNSPALRGELRLAEPLARHTSWRVGGPAERFYRPADLADLCALLQQLPVAESLFWLGLGSNLLVRDGGIRGTVIATHGALQGLTRTGPDTLRVEAGTPCAKVARYSTDQDLTGAEFLAGIPGVMGGALAMNAGAWGGETWSLVTLVETVDRQGTVRQRSPTDYAVAYRHIQGPPEEWFVAAHLRLEPGDGATARRRIRALLEQRARTQPLGVPSCGSVFRNPPGDYAARLIETAGLKGTCIGAACISTRHANFIINTGGAKAADLEALIHYIADTVARVHGVRLIPEVRVVGEYSYAARTA
jgi:UDP-N-acetylmuramate dehydrogenase